MEINRDKLPISRWRVLLLVFALSWLAVLCWWHRRVAMDDAWITFHYAQRLASGEGLAFNPGERLEGFSNLSWVLLSVPAMVANLDPLGWARILSMGCSAVLVGLLVMGWRRHEDAGPMGRTAVGGLALAGAVPLGVWTMGGLETALQCVLLLVYTLGLSMLLGRACGRGAAVACAAAMGLMVTRPEGFAFGLLLAVGLVRPGARLAAFHALAAFLVCLAFYTTWRFLYFGTIVANTVTAKVGGGLAQRVVDGVVYTGAFFDGPLIVVLALAGWAAISRFGSLVRPTRWAEDEALVLAAGLVAGMHVCFAIAVGGDWMPGGRFLVPAVAPLCVMMGVAVRRWPFFVRAVLVIFLLLGGLVDGRTDPELRWYRWAGRESGGLVTYPLREAGRWLADNAHPADLVAGSEAGVIPYFSRHRFLDMVGLVDAHLARVPGAMHEKVDADYVLSREPDWIVVNVRRIDGREVAPWPTDAAVMAHPEFEEHYVEAKRFPRLVNGPEWSLEPMELVIHQRRREVRP